jgi:hypothetical protein
MCLMIGVYDALLVGGGQLQNHDWDSITLRSTFYKCLIIDDTIEHN